MRSIAMARYRFLTTVRRTRWIFPVFFAAIFLPLCGAHIPLLLPDRNDFGVDSAIAFGAASHAMMWAYGVHALALALLCASYGAGMGKPESPPNLLETVPIGGQARFWGDAAGIFCSAMALHLCTTPLLAEAVAISPFPTSVFWYGEAVFALTTFFFSAAAAWSLAAFDAKRLKRTNPPVLLVFALMLMLVILAATRPGELAESIAFYVNMPSSVTWRPIVEAINRPLLLAALLFALYALFVAFFSIDTARLVEEQE